MGHQPRERMERLQQRMRAELPGRVIPLIGEGWNFGEVADGARFVQASQLSLNGSGIGSFNDRLRDAVRGGGAGDSGPALTSRLGWAFGLADAPADTPERQRAAQWLRAGAAGSLRTALVPMPDGSRRPAAEIDYAGQPAGYTAQPAEAVNYAENHDNQTLFDNGVMKLPLDTPREVRARAQWVALASVAFSQGVAYFHAGGELLRSKSLDRNSYNSGDWFNALDWSGRRHGFARGLPPAWDNQADWPAMRERLADPRIAPTPHEIAWMRERFLELLRIRASTPLLRLHSAEELRQRLTLLPADDAVLALQLDGHGRADAGFDGVLLLVNAARSPREVAVPAGAWRPHPALAGSLAPQAGRVQGRVLLPAQTAPAWVLRRGGAWGRGSGRRPRALGKPPAGCLDRGWRSPGASGAGRRRWPGPALPPRGPWPPAHPAGCAPPSPPPSAHGCRPWWWTRPHVPAAPARCGCPRPTAAGGWQSSAAACAGWRAGPPRRPAPPA